MSATARSARPHSASANGSMPGSGGSYELRLPPGKYEFVAWHEAFGEQASKIEIRENGAAELNFKFASTAGK